MSPRGMAVITASVQCEYATLRRGRLHLAGWGLLALGLCPGWNDSVMTYPPASAWLWQAALHHRLLGDSNACTAVNAKSECAPAFVP
jgi:hypothetical protein